MPLVTLPRTGPGSGTGASPGNRAPSWPLRIDPAAPQAEGLLAAMVRVGRGFVDISPYRRGVTPSGIEAADWSATVLGAPAIALNDVNDRITHGYGNGVDPAVAPFSIAFWLVPNQASVDQIHASFGLTPRYYLGIVGANGTWDMGVGASGVGNGGDGPAVVVGASTHIVLDHDGTDVRRYVNGVLVGSKPWSGGAVSGDLAMGRPIGAPSSRSRCSRRGSTPGRSARRASGRCTGHNPAGISTAGRCGSSWRPARGVRSRAPARWKP